MEFDFSKRPGRASRKKKELYSGKALISVITPYYNSGTYFEQTFHSVMNQTFPWFEWIIVNDGSSNEKDVSVLKQFSQKDARIRVIEQENQGLASARNAGIAESRTEIIVPLDADDLISPQYLEYVFFGLYYNPDADWCYTDVAGFQKQDYLWRQSWDARRLKSRNFLVATAAIRKSAIREVGGYKVEKWSYYEDWRFWLDMLSLHKKPVHVKGYFFWYRGQEGMLSGIKQDKERKRFCKRIIKEAGKTADITVRVVEYPLQQTEKPYYKIRRQECWDGYQALEDDNRTKILMIVPWMVMGGADKFNLDLAAGLDQTKFRLSIVTTVPSEHEWQQKFAEYTDEIFHLPDFLDPVYYAEFVAYFIQTRKIDVLFVTNSYRGYYMIPWLRKQFNHLSVVDYVHMEEWYWKEGGFARLSGRFGAVLDKTYVCNSATRQVLIRDFEREEDDVCTMHIGVDEKKYDPGKTATGKLYEKLGVGTDRPVILFPCRISPQKRPFLLLEIAKKVKAAKPEAVFAVVGDGPQLKPLTAEIKKMGLDQTIICVGRSDDMASCYRDAKITLICSIKEGLSLTAYESCAMGVPVISSDVGGQKDLIDNTVGALIPMRQKENVDFDAREFDSREIGDYANAILKLLSDQELYNKCSIRCREKIENVFSTDIMIEKMQREMTYLAKDSEQMRKHEEKSLYMRHAGDLPEELYTMELAEEDRSGEVGAIARLIGRISHKILAVNSRRRDMAVRLYKKIDSLRK